MQNNKLLEEQQTNMEIGIPETFNPYEPQNVKELLDKKMLEIAKNFLNNISYDDKSYERKKAEEIEKQKAAYKKAMVKATSEFPAIVTNKTVTKKDGKTYNYPDLKSMVDATKPILTKNGFYVEFRFKTNLAERSVTTYMAIIHQDGWTTVSEPFTMRTNTDDPQSIASAITYSKRYLYSAMLNLNAETDDDGSTASGRNDNKVTDKIEKQQAYQTIQPKQTKQSMTMNTAVQPKQSNPPKTQLVQPNQEATAQASSNIKCADCGQNVTEEEAKFSTKSFGKPYCINCQANH